MPSPTNAPASLPAQIAVAEGELPEDIAKAIDEVLKWQRKMSRLAGYPAAWRDSYDEARAALTATILARLTDAESAREAALARAERAEKALEGLEHDVSAIRFQVAEKAAFGVAPAIFGDEAPYAIGWRHACDAIAAEIRAAIAHPATAEET